jgi:hypothetical protein
MAFYQCFKTRARDTYASSTRYRNHDEGAEWVAACMAAFGIRGNDLLGKPFEADDQPGGAIVWPAAAT